MELWYWSLETGAILLDKWQLFAAIGSGAQKHICLNWVLSRFVILPPKFLLSLQETLVKRWLCIYSVGPKESNKDAKSCAIYNSLWNSTMER